MSSITTAYLNSIGPSYCTPIRFHANKGLTEIGFSIAGYGGNYGFVFNYDLDGDGIEDGVCAGGNAWNTENKRAFDTTCPLCGIPQWIHGWDIAANWSSSRQTMLNMMTQQSPYWTCP